MTRIILFSVVILASSTFSFAQMRFGISTGANFSNQTAIDDGESVDEGNRFLLGYNFKVLAEYILSDNMSLEGGLGYSRKGFSYKTSSTQDILGTETTIESDGFLKLNYLDIPILLKLSLPAGEGRVFAGAGPNLGIATGGKFRDRVSITSNGSTVSEESNGKLDFKASDANRFDYGVKGVLGYEKNGISVEAGYEYGIANFNTNPNNSTVIKNHVASITLGFKLGGY